MTSKNIILHMALQIYILILLSLFVYINNQNPYTFTLSNEKIIMVTNDGIKFFTSKMIEEINKRIIFKDIILSEENQDKINLVKFSLNK